MRPMLITRIHRRCVVKYFGSCRNLLIWTFSVLFTVFLLDSYLFSSYAQKEKLDAASGVISGASNPVKESLQNSSCGQPISCPYGQSSYLLKSGVGKDGQPVICFNGGMIFSPEKKNGKRGFCLVRINEKTMSIEDVRTFDTYDDDTVLQRYLNLGVAKNDLILLATADEASLHLSEASKKVISSFGSDFIDNLEFRDSFVMIGQRNLAPPSKAIEQLVKRKDGEIYAGEAFIQGCVSVPMGSLVESTGAAVPVEKGDNLQIEDKVKLGDYSVNCGLAEKCPDGSYPTHIYTGNKNLELPKICFRSRYVLGPDLNDAGRGLMVVLVDVNSGAVLDVKRFDTYEKAEQSAKLVEFLKEVKQGEMIIAVVHDEAQTALSVDAKDALVSFGSSFISQIGFRDVWVFVGKPNIGGFSPYEDIEPAGKDSWPFSIDAKLCVDKNFKGQTEKLDLNSRKNIARRTFCKTYDGYEEFCSGKAVDLHPKPLPLLNKTFEGLSIYNIPIVLIPGLSQVSTLKQLEALFAIPGLNLEKIVMMIDEKFEESKSLAALFNVTTEQLQSTTKYINLMHGALSHVWKMFPSAEYAIFLEEEVLPTPDFLSYLGQCLTVLKDDDSLIGATAFNENGFKGLSKRSDLVYRGKTFPGLGFMLKKSFFFKHMVDNLPDCCSVRSWFGWNIPEDMEMLIPDVSRVVRRIYLGLTEHADFIREYFNKARVYNKDGAVKLKELSNLSKKFYHQALEKLIASASPIPAKKLEACAKRPGIHLSGGVHVAFFKQSIDDETTLLDLCRCFNLLYAPKFKVRGIHDSTLRFTYEESEVILVGQKSSYYKLKPSSYDPFVAS